jgi:hypothetical protein
MEVLPNRIVEMDMQAVVQLQVINKADRPEEQEEIQTAELLAGEAHVPAAPAEATATKNH